MESKETVKQEAAVKIGAKHQMDTGGKNATRARWITLVYIIVFVSVMPVPLGGASLVRDRLLWAVQLGAYARICGSEAVGDDIRSGKTRLLELSSIEDDTPSQMVRQEGIFEVWSWPAGHTLQERVAAEAYADGYDSMMRGAAQNKGQ